ncbi:MAG: KOW motif-containing protein [Chloroflexi bacterium]|nr:KOW motif-containing protein [Chloroflexota bacterium]MCH9016547.1 KOW motif-containing protein [Chloroflexota bacterium]
MQWMRRRGDRVTITTGKYAGRTGTRSMCMHYLGPI